MELETLSKIEADAGSVRLTLRSRGKPSYQYVYRTAKGLYWDAIAGAFTFDGGRTWTTVAAIRHVTTVLREEMGIEVQFDGDVAWIGISEEARNALQDSPL